jgi:late competence protein required for DNA uptake (superfamily II DNA/RNA helicase)
MAKAIVKRKEEGELKCSRCGFTNADCLEYVDHELLCQNCIFLKMTEKERDTRNLGDLIDKDFEE